MNIYKKFNFENKFFLFFIFILFFLINTDYAKQINETKKIISVLYDDSASMTDQLKDAYANFSMQNIISLLNAEDKLNIVKISDSENNIILHIDNYEKRKLEISEVSRYMAKGKSSNFSGVKNAVSYLYDMKNLYGNDLSYEYYLVVLTDGAFDNYNNESFSFLKQLNNDFSNVVYKSFFYRNWW